VALGLGLGPIAGTGGRFLAAVMQAVTTGAFLHVTFYTVLVTISRQKDFGQIVIKKQHSEIYPITMISKYSTQKV
jgi:hypothetical protein